VVIYGQPHATITETEFELLRWMDGQRTVAEISKQMKQSDNDADVQEAIRLLAQRGIVDLLTEPFAMGKIRGKVVTEAV
jgi:predicted transcriptional regulator